MSPLRLALSLAVLPLAACANDGGDSKSSVDDGGPDDTGAPVDDNDDPIEPEPTDFGARGSHAVGHMVVDHDGAQLKAWYPTASDAPEDITYMAEVRIFGPDAPPMPFLGKAIADAAPDTAAGPYPLVVLSHGFGLSPEWYLSLAEHLASRGMVVLAPEHVEYDWATDVRASTAYRPLEVSEAIDFAEDGLLDGIIDTEHIGVVGHSYGGTTALAIGGARIHTAWLEEHCATNEDPFIDDFFCTPFLGQEEDLAALMGLDAVPSGLWPALSDPRVDSVVAMAPDAGLFGDVGLAELTVPTMVLGGTADTGAPWDWGGQLAWDHMSSDQRAYVAFEGADHFIMTTTCEQMPWTDGLPPEYAAYFCEDPAWDKPEALALVNETTAAWLATTLLGDVEGAAVLDGDTLADVDGLDVIYADSRPQDTADVAAKSVYRPVRRAN